MKAWVGRNSYDGSHKTIIDIYNSIRPLPVGYTMKYYDAWCDAGLSAAFYKAGGISLIGGGECGVGRHLRIFKNMGIWKGVCKPVSGDVVIFTWGGGSPDHIGIVESVSGSTVTSIECNKDERVGRRTFSYNAYFVLGYARPKYTTSSSTTTNKTTTNKTTTSAATIDKLAKDVIAGKYGNGDVRKNKLGSLYSAVQKRVNEMLAKPSKKSNLEIAKEIIRGKWGDGHARKVALEKAGYNYNDVQALVNKLLK